MDENTLHEKVDRIEKAESPLRKYAGSLVTIIFLAGGFWVTQNHVEVMASENKEEIARVKIIQSADRLAMVRVEGKQEALAEDMQEVKESQLRLERKIDRLLESR